MKLNTVIKFKSLYIPVWRDKYEDSLLSAATQIALYIPVWRDKYVITN